LLGLWIAGAVITLGLLSFNLPLVQQGHAALPYLMASIGYPGLFLITLLFVWRFLSSLEARTHVNTETSLAAATVAPSGAG